MVRFPGITPPMSNTLVTLDDVRAAASRVGSLAVRTPLVGPFPVTPRSAAFSDVTTPGAGLRLKCEHLQPMGAFKIRGACNFIAQLSPAQRDAGVITYSSGNHGQAVAMVAERAGIRAVVVMPENAPAVKRDGVVRYGGVVILAGTTSVERKRRAELEASTHGLTIVPPFDHAAIIAGAGTVGLEIVETFPAVQTVYVPVGGGGLLAGVAVAVKGLSPTTRVVGVEPEGAAKMAQSLAHGGPVTLGSTASLADGLLPLRPGDLTFAHVRALVDEVVTVSEDAIVDSVRWLYHVADIRAEPSGAVAVAAARAAREAGSVAVVSGGNVDPGLFTSLIAAGPLS